MNKANLGFQDDELIYGKFYGVERREKEGILPAETGHTVTRVSF